MGHPSCDLYDRPRPDGAMFESNADAMAVWAGLALAGVALAGVVAELPRPPAPDADEAARTVDAVAASEYPSTGDHPLQADELRIGPHRLALRGDGGTSHASLSYGPVTPAAPGSGLCAVARGAPPGSEFSSHLALAAAAAAARSEDPRWRPADRTLVAKRVSWEDVDVTLVCA